MTNKRNNWVKEEDTNLLEGVEKYGQDWYKISDDLRKLNFDRKPKACRERYYNQLRPNMRKDEWTQEEENQLFDMQYKLGNKWNEIAERLNRRTGHFVKNYFYSTVRKVLRRLMKAAGNRKCSAQANRIKPRVLSQIFSITEGQEQYIEFDKEFTNQFREIILKYRNVQLKNPQISLQDYDSLKAIFQRLKSTNSIYEDNIQTKFIKTGLKTYSKIQIRPHNQSKKIKKNKIDYNKQNKYIIDRIQRRLPVFKQKYLNIQRNELKQRTQQPTVINTPTIQPQILSPQQYIVAQVIFSQEEFYQFMEYQKLQQSQSQLSRKQQPLFAFPQHQPIQSQQIQFFQYQPFQQMAPYNQPQFMQMSFCQNLMPQPQTIKK